MLPTHSGLLKIAIFRKNMKLGIEESKINQFWPDFEPLDSEFISDEKNVEIKNEKISIAKKYVKDLLIFDWVKFVGISGSVAAGTLQEKDDIDLFIVVKNDRMWLYRGIILLRLLSSSVRRMWGEKEVANKLDTNFICEERGVVFKPGNIFIAHELLYLIPIYNEGYYDNLLDYNAELLGKYEIKRELKSPNSSRSLLGVLDFMAFNLQLLYMKIYKHDPEIMRLKINNRLGRIAFYPKGYNLGKVREYKELKSKYPKL